MDTRTLGYIGLGILVGIVVATLIGVPPVIWIAAAIVAFGTTVAVVMAQSDGANDAVRILAQETLQPAPASESKAPEPARSSSVEMEIVRAADDGTDTPAVWLHRKGGRRVHRFETAAGWVVQRVSTKDPDNPRKRVIGEPLTVASEVEAITAADELAQGQTPNATFLEPPTLAVAKA